MSIAAFVIAITGLFMSILNFLLICGVIKSTNNVIKVLEEVLEEMK